MKENFVKINAVNGPIMFIVFVQIISWISSTTIDTLDDENWPNRCFMTLYYMFYLLTLFLAAEANYKVTLKPSNLCIQNNI
jgi:apolipoprotein N-acyltransferase